MNSSSTNTDFYSLTFGTPVKVVIKEVKVSGYDIYGNKNIYIREIKEFGY